VKAEYNKAQYQSPGRKMKSVAIYGFAPQTRDLIKQSTADEVWSLNNFFSYGLPIERVTRTFEMHELWIHAIGRGRTEGGAAYWQWLLDPHDFPVYMHMVKQDYDDALIDLEELDLTDINDETKEWIYHQKKVARICSQFFDMTKADIRKYPFDRVYNNLFPKLLGVNTDVFPEQGINPYFTSSMDYMIALAIYEGFWQIEFYGIELKEKTEYEMQKASMEFWVGLARGCGIRMLIPSKSQLCNAPLYGLGEAQMIAVQIPEQLKRQYLNQMQKWQSNFNHLSGQYTGVNEKKRKSAKDKEQLTEMLRDLEIAKSKIFMYEGAAREH
jgi:hypothetical protein